MRLAGFANAFANRRFRWLLLAIAFLGLVPDFVWNGVVAPLLSPNNRFDDFLVFQAAALCMRSGGDPYLDFIRSAPQGIGRWDGYVYPPVFAWLLQPVAGWTGFARALLIVTAALLCLGVSLFCLVRALRVRDRQAIVLMALLFVAFFPVLDNIHWGQINLLLLATTCIWCLGYVQGGRWWGGVALGFGVAVKLLQAPLVLAYVANRWWRPLAVCLLAAAGFTVVGFPWLVEYGTVVLPAVGGGTGWMGNISPAGALMRLSDGALFMNHAYLPMPTAVRLGAVAVAAGVLAVDWAVARRIEPGRTRRLAEAAVLVASLPLISPVTWDGHLALQLLPLCVVGWIALPKRMPLPLALAAGAILLMGAESSWYWTMATSGALSNSPWARPLAELPLAGIVLNWAAATTAALGLAAAPIRVESRLRPASSVG